MKTRLAVLFIILLLIVLTPIMVTEAQSTVKLMSWFGEGKYWQGYDFSAGEVQTINTIQEEGDISFNPLLSPDFYLGSSCFPVSTTSYHSPIPVINYGNTQLGAVTEIPAKNDGRFATQAFVQGNTYGLFTLEGDFVAVRILSITQFGTAGYEMDFSWQYVKQGQPGGGVLNLSLSSSGKTDYTLGENIRIEGKLLLDGAPVADGFVTINLKDSSGKDLSGITLPTDNSGGYWFELEYGWAIPNGYQGDLLITASANYNSSKVNKSINVKYGSEPAKKILALELFGPKDPIQIGGFDSIGIAGKVTSQGADVDGALVTMKVAGQTFQTTTGTHTSGSFNWYWNNDTFLAGNYTVEVTVTKDGYQTATGKVPFTVLGEGYDYQVVMDPIPPQLAPATSVSFPGKYYFAGKPHAGWLEIDVTFPNGRTNTYTELTQNDGRFTFKLPSMMETGFYTLKVFRHETRVQISNTYTWKVGEDNAEDDSDVIIPPKPVPYYQIVDVQYPAEFTVGQPATISGRVIDKQGDTEIPQEGWQVVTACSPLKQWSTNPNDVRYGTHSWGKAENITDSNGRFNIRVTPLNNLSDEVVVYATKDYIKYKPGLFLPWTLNWHGPLSIVNPLDPILNLEQTDYDRGTIVSGNLQLRPAGFFQYWKDSIKVIYKVSGPLDGTETNYFFAGSVIGKNDHNNYGDNDNFSWLIPGNAGTGMYEITAYITGRFLPPAQVSARFFVNDIVATKVSVRQQASIDGWGSAELTGLYSDFKGGPIPGDKLRVHFYTDSGTDNYREYEMKGIIEQDGTYTLNLEPFDLFAAKGQVNPWAKQQWVATVFAEKDSYATAAAIIPVITPTIDPKIEIVSVTPDTDYFNRIARGGINYSNLIDMDIKVKVRYNNIFDGAELTVGSGGHWGTYERDNDSSKLYFHLNVENAELPFKLSAYDRTWVRYLYDGGSTPLTNYHFPVLFTSIPAKTGLAQESEFTVKGKIDLSFYGRLLNYSTAYKLYSPTRFPVIEIYAIDGPSSFLYTIGKARAIERFYFTPPAVTPAEIEVELEKNSRSQYGYSFNGVVADGWSKLAMTVKVHRHQREGSLKVSSKLGKLEGNALDADGEITLKNGVASLTYVPPEYLKYQDLTEYNEKTGLWHANVPIIFTYTAKDGSVQEQTVNIKVYNTPVMLVHGFTGDRDTWKELAIFLNKRKYNTHQGYYYAGDGSIPAQSSKLEDNIVDLKYAYQFRDIKLSKVDLVVHSMGGLISRYYLGGAVRETNRDGFGKPFLNIDLVRKLIMVATPNHGSTWFDLQIGRLASSYWVFDRHKEAAEQLYHASPFIINLNANESSGLHLNSNVEYGNIYSYSDRVGFFSGDAVVRSSSAHLNGVQSHVLEHHVHSPGMLGDYPSVTESTFVFEKVYEWLGKKIERAPLENIYVTIYSAKGDVKIQTWWWPDPVPVNINSLPSENLRFSPNDTIITGPDSKATLDFIIQKGSSPKNIPWGSIHIDENTELQLGNLSPALSEIRLIKGSARFITYRTEHNNHFSVDLVADDGQWQTVQGLNTDFIVTAGTETQIYSLEGDVLVGAASTDSEDNYALISSGEGIKINEIGSIDKISQPDSGWWENGFYNESFLANIRTYLVILIEQGKTLMSLYRSDYLKEMPIQDLSIYAPVVLATVTLMITALVILITMFFKRKILLILIPLLAGLLIGGWTIFNNSLHYNMADSDAGEGFESNLSLTIAEEGILPLQVAKRYSDYDQFSEFNTEDGVRVNLIAEGDNCDLESKTIIFDVLFELVSGNSDHPYHRQEKTILVDKMGLLIYQVDSETGIPNAAADAIIPWGQISAGRSGLAEGPVTVPLDFVVSADVPYISGISKMRITVDPDQLYGEKVIREITGWYNYQTWSALFGELEETTTGLVYLIKGEINLEGEIWFEAVRLVEGSAAESGVGEYEVQMLTSGGDLLFSTSFNPDGQTGAISLSLPYQAGVAEIIVFKEGNIVAEFKRSANPPEIGFNTIPLVDQESGTMEVYWEATDYDGDPLLYDLYAQYDQDHPLILIASDLSVNNLSVNLNQLPGKQCLLMVTASDGFNTAQSFSELVMTPPRGPAVNIMLDENITYDANQPVLLRATTTDAFNGNIPGENLIWYSDLDGRLGTGSVLFAPLTKGTHEISLLASDLTGNMTIETVEIKVGELLAGMGSGLQGLWFIGAVLLLLFISLIVMFILILKMRKRKKQISH